MFKNYLVVAIRSIRRDAGYTSINIIGLAVGMACCALIALYVQDELSVDAFHNQGDRIYRLIRERQVAGGAVNYSLGTSGEAGPMLAQDFPEVESTVRYLGWGAYTKYEDRAFDAQFAVVDKNFLEVFDFPLLTGDPRSVLESHGSILITDTEAKRFFGDADPIGKVVEVDNRYMGGSFKITGVLADPPENSTLQFGFVTATQDYTFWMDSIFTGWATETSWVPISNFLVLREGADPDALEAKLPAFLRRYVPEDQAQHITYHLQKFKDNYLYARRDYDITFFSDITYVYLFATVGVFILVLACINFTNLATARSAGRAREVGLRKTVGAFRGQLVRQFLAESIVTALVAAALAIILVIAVLPELNAFTEKAISFDGLSAVKFVVTMILLAVFTGVLAGVYPALFLSSFMPVAVLKATKSGASSGSLLRKVLVVFQFAVSVFLIVGTLTVYLQLDFVQNKNLGFDKDQILLLPIFSTDRRLTDRYHTVKDAFLRHPSVLKASGSHSSMGYGGQLDEVYAEGHEGTDFQWRVLGVDEDMLETYDIELVAGRGFDPTIISDTTKAFILNETAVRALGWDDPDVNAAVGKEFGWRFFNRESGGRVIGVVKDFHNRALHEEIRPVVIAMWLAKMNVLALKIRGENVEETIAHVEKVWRMFIPEKPPVHFFLDESLEQSYRQEVRVGHMSNVFSGLAVLIGCMGLVGLASYTTEQRTKEIGIRKSIGASEGGIVVLMTREFAILVLVANVIAIPIAWYALQDWLAAFHYRIELGPGIFLVGAVASISVALLTVGYHAIRAAGIDPVEALHHE
jgi:putative ABC transport system permease protein